MKKFNNQKNKQIVFDFGENWKNYSYNAISKQKIKEAKKDFKKLFNKIDLKGKTFIDIGFGQGLSLLIAQQLEAKPVGCEINRRCLRALLINQKKFFKKAEKIPVVIGSILDQKTIQKLKKINLKKKDSKFQIVHSWGVLHHSGKMWKAINNAVSLVTENGYLAISIYNKHWSSPFWHKVKYFYNISPRLIRRLLIFIFYWIIFIGKFIITGEDPFKLKRGMDYYFNIIDWVGGYPYEYASIKEVKKYIELKGFRTIKVIPAQMPTGCNEFVFIKKKE